VLAPVNVNTDAPLFTRLPAPLSTPLKVVSDAPLAVSTLPCRFNAPAPASVAISSSLASFTKPDAFTVTAMLFASALPPDSVNVPPFTVVVPLNAFAPLRVSSDAPSFTRLYAPLRIPLNVAALATVNVVSPFNDAFPLKVSAPLFVASPTVSAPFRTSAFASVRAVPESEERRPPVNVSVPVPSAASSPA
jgi:hypothetical protein